MDYEILYDEIKSYHADGKKSTITEMKEKEPDLIFIDLFDPSIDSFNILAELNAEGLTKDIPVIAFVGSIGNTDVGNQLNNKLHLLPPAH